MSALTAYWSSADHTSIAILGGDSCHWVYLPVADDLDSLPDGLPPEQKAAAHAPLDHTELETVLAKLRDAPQSAPPTPAEKLASVGLTVDELKALLAG